MLTAYTDLSLTDAGTRRVSLGGRFDNGPSVKISLEGAHSEAAHGATDHSIMLRGDLRW